MKKEFYIKRFKQGDRPAFNELYEYYWKNLFLYAYKIYQDGAICQDIVQEVFINLWERNSENEILNIEAFLFRSVKNRIANRIRDLKWNDAIEDIVNSISSDEKPDNVIELKETTSLINEIIQNLPPRCQEIFRLSRFENKDNTTIAKELNLSIRTVETQISKALAQLRKHFPSMLL